MNIFILTDLEGISGVSTIEAVLNENSSAYAEARERLMADTNAAVNAAFDAGAEGVYVCDGHGGGRNFIAGALDERATQVWVKELHQVAKDVDAFVHIGSHAMGGTQKAFLDHTMWSVGVHHYYYNGQRIGELMQSAVFMGHFGVPLVAVSGDKAACEEVKRFFGDVPVACVKEAEERNVATCIPNREAEDLIYRAVKNGIENRARFQPTVMPLPFEVKVEFNRSDYCDNACRGRAHIERLDAYTARCTVRDITDYSTVIPL